MSTNLQERSLQVVQPPVDALQEFKVQTRTYSAEFGKAAGAIINASIKQGSNKFRGSVFEFFRDEAFNANLWDNNRANRAKGAFNQHIPGGTLGGPIVRDRTFFFGDYQATRTEQAQSNLSVVPTALMRQGNLTELSHCAHQLGVHPCRMRRYGQQDHQRILHRSGRARDSELLPACRTSRPSSRRPAFPGRSAT